MNNEPLVSIAMATYNGEKFLKEQIDSILNQTYKNLEIVIVDDCSHDKTFQILIDYSKIDNRVKVFKNLKNLGFVKNFMKAISLCNGQYIALSDQDDIWEKWKISESLKYINNYDLVCTNSLLINDENLPLGYTMKETLNFSRIPHNQEFIFKHLCHQNFVQGSTILAKASFLKNQIKNVDSFNNLIFHDYYFAFKASLGNGIFYIPKCSIRYRQHSSQVTINIKRNTKKKEFKDASKLDFNSFCSNRTRTLSLFLSEEMPYSLIKYTNQTIKYFASLEKKSFYTISYFYKNYYFIFLSRNLLKKNLIISKKIIVYITFHIKNYFSTKFRTHTLFM